MNKDIRWLQRFDNYTRVLKQLQSAVKLSRQRNLTELEAQGMVQTFEYTHELAWKTLKDFLKNRGISNIYGSNDATKEAFRLGLIKEGEIWMNMIKSRNMTLHTYNEDTAHEIVTDILAKYYHEFVTLKEALTELKEKELDES